MKKFTTLVAFDFSKSSVAVLKQAIDFTKKRNGELHVVHVIEDSFFSKKTDLQAAKEHGYAELHKEFKTVQKEHYHCVKGKIKVEVANTANVINADIIIMGNSGATHFLNELLMGSHTKEIVKHAQTSVLVVKDDHELQHKKITLLSDLSKASAEAVEKTAAFFPDAEINILNLFYLPVDNKMTPYGLAKENLQEYQDRLRNESKESLDSFVASLSVPKTLRLTSTSLESSLNAKMFNKETQDVDFDLLVIHVTHNISFFAFDILEQSNKDVLIIK